MVFRNKGTVALVIAAFVLVGYIAFLLVANYQSHQRLVNEAVERIKEDLTKRSVAVSYFSSERINDVKAIAAGRELAFYYSNKALGMSLRYGLSANIDEIKSSFDRLLKEKRIGGQPIYVRIDFVSNGDDLHVTRLNPDGPILSDEDLMAFLKPDSTDVEILIHRQFLKSRLAFSMPYRFKEMYMGQIVAWVDLDTVYRHLIQVNERSSKRLILAQYGAEYLPLPSDVTPFVEVPRLPAPDRIPVGMPCNFDTSPPNSVGLRVAMIRVPVERTPLHLISVMPTNDLIEQRPVWGHSLFLGFLSLIVLASIGFLLRIKDQNLILNIRLDESTKQQEAITLKNIELSKEISEREEAERALRSSEAKYRKLHESMRDGFVSFDCEGRVIECNSAFQEMLGYGPDEIASLTNETITPPAWLPLESAIICGQVVPRGYSETYEKEFSRKNGTTFPVELRTYSLRDEAGSQAGTWAIFRNVADRKRAEEDLKTAKEAAERASLAKSEFLASMSHELRTPLHHVLGFTELLTHENCGPLNDMQKKYLNHAISSSQHLLSLINDILDISKVEAGKTQLQLSEVLLAVILEDSLSMVREKATKNNIVLSTKFEDLPERIVGDERVLKQILYNLLSNATKYTPNGSICLAARRLTFTHGSLRASNGRPISPVLEELCAGNSKADFLEVSVADTGIGLLPSALKTIFNPFEQVDSSLNRKLRGTGLGLALTKDFVELHGGRIWAESEGEGKGSVFRFVIPVSPVSDVGGQ